MPITITKDTYQTEVLDSEKPIIIDVYADWCGPCQQMNPIIQALEAEYGDKYKFVKLNVDESRDLAVQFGVTSIPTFIFMKDGQVKGKETGYIAQEDLLGKIKELLD